MQPPWTEDECRTLIRNRQLPVDQLLQLIPTRKRGGIEAALGGIDQYIRGRDIHGLLSKRFLRILKGKFRVARHKAASRQARTRLNVEQTSKLPDQRLTHAGAWP